MRVVGTLSDVTDAKTAEERLLHDAVHDNLTGLPNRELFYDRLDARARRCARRTTSLRPTVLVHRSSTASSRSTTRSASRPATPSCSPLSRRLGRLLKPQDTLARIAGDEFAMILLSEREPDRIIALRRHRSAARSTTPITFAEREIFLTASVGLALHDPQIASRREDVLQERRDRHGARQAPGRRPHRGVPPDHALATAATG